VSKGTGVEEDMGVPGNAGKQRVLCE